jgi:hypothetical protein
MCIVGDSEKLSNLIMVTQLLSERTVAWASVGSNGLYIWIDKYDSVKDEVTQLS